MSNENESIKKQYDKMTKTPVNKLVRKLAIPTVISMLITMVYNVADTYFVSKISVAASGATGVVFSLMAILQAFGFMFGQGSGTNISQKLGAKDVESARRYSSTGFFMSLFIGIVMAALGLIFITPLMNLLGSTNTILPYAKIYGSYILICAPAMVTSCTMNNILRYEGMAKFAMVGLSTGGVLNMVLDPILIFGLKMGITGAGLATAISQYISMALLLAAFVLKKCQSRISFKYLTFDGKLIWSIMSTGLPSFARQGLNSVSTMLLNNAACVYGDECVSAMSIVAKCTMLMYGVSVGIGQGFQPVSSFNYGAKNYDRVKQGVYFVWRYATIVVAIIAGIMFIFAPQAIKLFRSEAAIVSIGVATLRFMCVALVAMPTAMIANMAFQSIGRTSKAFFLACAQNGLFFIPLLLILPKIFGIKGVEVAQPIGYLIASLIALPMIINYIKELTNKSKGE